MNISVKHTALERSGMLFFLLALYSVGTISSITASWTFSLICLFCACVLIIISDSARVNKRVSNIVISWMILTLFCALGVLRGSSYTRLAFYSLGFVMLLLSESVSLDVLFYDLKWLKVWGLFFAVGCYWQLMFPDQYYATLYPLFPPVYQKAIRRQFTFHHMCTGFTSQTAFTAEFIVLAMMATMYTTGSETKKRFRIISAFELTFLLGALLLTGKRSPLLSYGLAFIVVDMLTRKRSKRNGRITTIILILIIASTVFYFLSPFLTDSRNAIVRLIEYSNYQELGEATNGRLTLYAYAIDEFLKHPILGIGWGKYGMIYETTGAHNIYLQLLCECGIFGFIICISGMIFALWKTGTMLKKYASVNDKTTVLLKCSVFIQVYILVYGMFGNPLYDPSYLLMYLLGLFISAAVYLNSQRSTGKN